MHNLPVAIRIVGGYFIVVLLAAVIAFVGYSGISLISDSFNRVTERSMPMIDNSNQLVSNILLAQRELSTFEKADKLSQLDPISQKFQQLMVVNRKISNELRELLKDSDGLNKRFNKAEKIQSAFVDSGNNLMTLHRESLQQAMVVSDQKLKFTDMGDETLSFLYDLENDVELDATKKLITYLENEIDNISITVNESLRSRIKMAVLQGRSDLNDSLTSIEETINSLAQSSDLLGNKSFGGVRDAYQRQKSAADALLNAYLEQIAKETSVADSFVVTDQLTSEFIELFSLLVKDIRTSADEAKLESQSAMDASRVSLIVFTLIAIGASIVVAFFITRSIRLPLSETVAIIKTIATGDLTYNFQINRKDELGQLMYSMKDLVTQLRNMLSETSANSEQLASTAEQSSSISEVTFNNITQQKQQTDQMATAINEMTATVNEVANSASLTLVQVESAHKEVQNGEEVLGRNVKRFESLACDIGNAAIVIQKLNDDCKNIGGVLDVIKSVAEQTNLLALNAAIEAARAGEQGRGFAVVADEVRTLASRAHASTAEIEDMIVRLQARANEAVSVMDKSQQEAKLSVESISEASDVLKHVATAILTIKDMSYQIASAAEQQATASQAQLESMITIANIAEETSTGARETQSASQELAKMAEIQRALVGRFKL